MPRFNLATLPSATIRTAENCSLPATFAADELQRYLQQMSGVRVPVLADASVSERNALVLGRTAERPEKVTPRQPGSFEILPEAAKITLAAGSPRALVDAVYALLTQFGCQWSLHGRCEETVPQLPAPSVELQRVLGMPSFAVRGYCSDIMTWHYTQPEFLADRLDDDRAFVDWMGKSGANAFFFIRHPFDTQLTIPELLPDFQRRGIDVEYGGHVVPLLLPRELFRDHPRYFPQAADGHRTEHGNLCTSHPGALAAASAQAVQTVRDHPEMSVVHIWGADLWHGGWCACAACQALSPQDQSLRICNAVARALAEAGLARPVCYLAYHDTIDPDVTIRPDGNVMVEFAPRERCYGHALNDPACTSNRRYAAALERYVDLFEGRVRLFEYYGDAILFFGCAVPLTQVIAADLDYYGQLGVDGITMLQFGSFSVWAYPLNFAAFAAQLMRVGGFRSSVDAYCARFGSHAPAASAAFAELEGIMQQVATYGDIRRPPRDPVVAASVVACVEDALPRLMAVARSLEKLGDETLKAQGALIGYTHKVLEGVCQELRAAATGNPSRAEDRYGEALQIIETVERRFKGLWGTVDLPIIHSFYGLAAGPE
jgi:hypothetical protein